MVWIVDSEPNPSILHRLGSEFGKFGLVGLANYALDLALFNVLLFTVFAHAPWVAKACSTLAAATSSYFMNRHWTWRHRERNGTARELSVFFLISAVALGLTELCLLVSHVGFGLTTKLDDNISANVVGLILSTGVRFWAFRTFVFLQPGLQPGAQVGAVPDHDVEPNGPYVSHPDAPVVHEGGT